MGNAASACDCDCEDGNVSRCADVSLAQAKECCCCDLTMQFAAANDTDSGGSMLTWASQDHF